MSIAIISAIISRIHSGLCTSPIAAASPNIMIMYFTVPILSLRGPCGQRHKEVGADSAFSTSPRASMPGIAVARLMNRRTASSTITSLGRSGRVR